eukprot:358192-Chlamydomonas_euryale.AAC.20
MPVDVCHSDTPCDDALNSGSPGSVGRPSRSTGAFASSLLSRHTFTRSTQSPFVASAVSPKCAHVQEGDTTVHLHPFVVLSCRKRRL